MTQRLRSRAGFSLPELMVYVAFASWIGYMVSQYITLPTKVTKTMVTVTSEQSAYSTTNVPIDDLKCALSTSIQWGSIDPSQPPATYNPSTNPTYMPWFQVNDPSIVPPALPISFVCYVYRSGTIYREFISGGPPINSPAVNACAPVAGDNAQESIIATGVLPPTAAMPLFAIDPAAQNMVILTLQFPGTGTTPITVVRRVHIRT